jgi:hypothetical protein
MISSFENQPDVNGKPASARAPIVNVTNVNGMARRKPPIRSMSWMPAIAPMIEPAPMKSSALKKACVIRWKSPAL